MLKAHLLSAWDARLVSVTWPLNYPNVLLDWDLDGLIDGGPSAPIAISVAEALFGMGPVFGETEIPRKWLPFLKKCSYRQMTDLDDLSQEVLAWSYGMEALYICQASAACAEPVFPRHSLTAKDPFATSNAINLIALAAVDADGILFVSRTQDALTVLKDRLQAALQRQGAL